MTSGVYRIQIGDSFYYGSSKDLSGRKRTHERSLRQGKHYNRWMQRAFDKHQSFEFTVVEECDPAIRYDREQELLDEFYTHPQCMNLNGSARLPKEWFHTEEARKRISASSTGRRHTQEAIEKIRQTHTGMMHTEETKAKMRKPKSPEQVARLYGNTYASALKGTKMSAEAIETNRRSHTGLKQSETTMQKRRDTWALKKLNGTNKNVRKSRQIAITP